MSLTGNQLLVGFSNFLNDYWVSTTTAAGTTTNLVDSLLGRYGNDTLIDKYIRITKAAHSAIYEVRRISDFTASSTTAVVAPAFSATTGSGSDYEMHNWDPARKFAALDSAIISLVDELPLVIYNETVTLDGLATEFSIPSNIRRGPMYAQLEAVRSADASWNFLTNPRGDSLTSWTVAGSGASAALYDEDDSDLLVPKYDASCTKVSVPTTTAVTYRQVVGDMTNGVTAANAAGRKMTLAMWVYCNVASRVTIEFIDDNGAVATSSSHSGSGWELLTCTGVVSAGNATTLTAGIAISSAAALVEVFWNRGWFYYGDQLFNTWGEAVPFEPRRDGSVQKILLNSAERGKRQLRLVGTGPLSTLGTTAATQATNTVEVDVNSAEIIYGKAAQIFLGQQLFTNEDLFSIQTRVTAANARLPELKKLWHNIARPKARIFGPYAR